MAALGKQRTITTIRLIYCCTKPSKGPTVVCIENEDLFRWLPFGGGGGEGWLPAVYNRQIQFIVFHKTRRRVFFK